MAPRDASALEKPTRDNDPSAAPPVIEQECWPDEARIVTLMGIGFTFSEAWDTTLPEYRRYASINHAWSIPAKRRDNMVREATQAEMDEEWGRNL